MEEEQKLNISINEGSEFFAHELSVNFNPTQFILDFKSVTPRVDPRSKEKPSISIKHNVILADPYHAKQIKELLTRVLDRYEKEYGKIDKPKAIIAFEKKHKKKIENNKKDNTKATPNYFG